MTPFANPFFGWRVVAAAFVVAVFSWGFGFYGPPVFLHVIQGERGWSVGLVSSAITAHFLLGALFVMNLPAWHRRFGLPAVTAAGAAALALGIAGWAAAQEPWQLFAATLLSGPGWGATSGAAITAMVSPWFVRRRPAALSMAYNGASIGGVLFSPLWVAAIAAFGFASAAAMLGAIMAALLGLLAARYFSRTPADLGLRPDGDAGAAEQPAAAARATPALPGRLLWRDWRFQTLAAGTAIGLFAQIGLIAHLFSLLVPALGAPGAGLAAGFATACALAGRTLLAFVLPDGAGRRAAASANYGVQVLGCIAFIAAAGTSVPLLIVGVILFGAGIGNATSLPPLIAQSDFAEADVPRAVALVTASQQATYAFAPAAFGVLRDLAPAAGGAEGAPAVFAAAAVLQIVAAGVYLIGRR